MLDHGSTDPDRIGPFDVIVDTVGADLSRYRGRLSRTGRMVTVGLSRPALAAIAASTVHGTRRIRTFSANADAALLRNLAEYVDSGALRAVADSVHPLADIAAANEAFERGGVMGKHVVTIAE